MAPMTMNARDSYTFAFAGVPPGFYTYCCTPHLAMGIVGTITVK
jgi:plastocyanin